MYRPRSAFMPFSKLLLPMAMVVFVWIAYLLQPILTPFVAAAVLAYILNPVVTWLNRFAIRRAIASMLVMLATVIGLAKRLSQVSSSLAASHTAYNGLLRHAIFADCRRPFFAAHFPEVVTATQSTFWFRSFS